jgi:hypothetical protein
LSLKVLMITNSEDDPEILGTELQCGGRVSSQAAWHTISTTY